MGIYRALILAFPTKNEGVNPEPRQPQQPCSHKSASKMARRLLNLGLTLPRIKYLSFVVFDVSYFRLLDSLVALFLHTPQKCFLPESLNPKP